MRSATEAESTDSLRRESRIRLSSPITPVLKFVWAPWVLLFAALAVFAAIENRAPWFVVVGVAFFAWCVFSIAVASYLPLCRVHADDAGLWVKRGRKKAFVPFSRIWRVSRHSSGFRPRLPVIQIKTRERTAFGGAIAFIPVLRGLFQPEVDMVRWLEDSMREARANSEN